MAIYYARANGNVNGTIWATTPSGTASNLFSSFTSADTLYANNFTVTLNVNTTVLDVRADNTNSATAGGSFTLNDGVTLTANVVAGSTNACVTYAGSSPNSASIVGSVTGGTGASDSGAIRLTGTGNLIITGNITGGSGSGTCAGLSIAAAGNITLTGNVLGGSAGSCFGIAYSSTPLAFTANITGSITGGPNATAAGMTAPANSTTTVTGTVSGGTAAPGLRVDGSCTVTVTRAKGNGFGNGSAGLAAAVGVNNTSQTATVRVSEIEYGDLGMTPTIGPIILTDSTSNVALFYRTSGGKKTLVDNAATVDYPANSNVRTGTVFANGNRTGTCSVPAAGSVALGVAVDNTTGTAVLTPAAVWSFATSSATTSGSMGERLANAATVASTGQQLANALTP